jgi:hypothetical protein
VPGLEVNDKLAQLHDKPYMTDTGPFTQQNLKNVKPFPVTFQGGNGNAQPPFELMDDGVVRGGM